MSKPVGGINWGMKAHGQRYLRARTEISTDKDRDICGQKRRYPPAKLRNGATDKVHIGHNSSNGYLQAGFTVSELGRGSFQAGAEKFSRVPVGFTRLAQQKRW